MQSARWGPGGGPEAWGQGAEHFRGKSWPDKTSIWLTSEHQLCTADGSSRLKVNRATLHHTSEETCPGQRTEGHGRPCPTTNRPSACFSLWVHGVLLILSAQPITHGPRHCSLASDPGNHLLTWKTHSGNTAGHPPNVVPAFSSVTKQESGAVP